jgi:hypothetical protein
VLRDDEYELMPHTELEYLRKEVERLKRNPLGDTQASISLLDSMNKLSVSVSRLNDILTGANDEMVKAYSDASVQEQLRRLGEQNEKLARGIVAVAELVKEVQRKQDAPSLNIDQFIASREPPKPVAPPAPAVAPQQMVQAEAPAVVAKNPFAEESGPDFTPLLNQPLPRPTGGVPQGIQNAMEQMRPVEPPQQSQENAPGFMLRPGLRERIPDNDVPPPPPPRRF